MSNRNIRLWHLADTPEVVDAQQTLQTTYLTRSPGCKAGAFARNGQSTRVMSAIGTKQTSVRVASMSALEVKRTLL
jgi:hypothetical protein